MARQLGAAGLTAPRLLGPRPSGAQVITTLAVPLKTFTSYVLWLVLMAVTKGSAISSRRSRGFRSGSPGRRAAAFPLGERDEDVPHPIGADAGAVDQRQRHRRLDPQLQGAFVSERGPDQRPEHRDRRNDFHQPRRNQGLIGNVS